jgi:hypothetical protein
LGKSAFPHLNAVGAFSFFPQQLANFSLPPLCFLMNRLLPSLPVISRSYLLCVEMWSYF